MVGLLAFTAGVYAYAGATLAAERTLDGFDLLKRALAWDLFPRADRKQDERRGDK